METPPINYGSYYTITESGVISTIFCGSRNDYLRIRNADYFRAASVRELVNLASMKPMIEFGRYYYCYGFGVPDTVIFCDEKGIDLIQDNGHFTGYRLATYDEIDRSCYAPVVKSRFTYDTTTTA